MGFITHIKVLNSLLQQSVLHEEKTGNTGWISAQCIPLNRLLFGVLRRCTCAEVAVADGSCGKCYD
jgi:hypothetical protein